MRRYSALATRRASRSAAAGESRSRAIADQRVRRAPAILPALGARLFIDKHPNRGRQVAVLPFSVDVTHEFGEVHAAPMRILPQLIPEYVFETDAGAMSADDDRALENARSQISPMGRTLSSRLLTIWGRLAHLSSLMASIPRAIISGHLLSSRFILFDLAVTAID